ncbi:hypothetical protein [Mycolicibacterium sp.]|uniref:hypothetical protein n=1 Tax=Mycolicibacterium sp. TaxID=2320850 RepID=UPI001A26DB73|nr:hypothetical protein [Mycolicibacterium sp.]MBJ7341615.1 hypothetical protein [Mycolicibacterium sp.]
MRFTDDPADTTALRAWARQLFGTAEDDEDDEEPPSNVVPREGENPSTVASDEARARDFTRRMFDADYAARQQPLNEE